MIENEQLGKELGYHIRQTELLLQKNEKLVQENIDLHRKVLLAKEVQEDLLHRNRMNQKTIRILLYKLRERHYAMKSEKHAKDPELKEGLLCQGEQSLSPQPAETMEQPAADGFWHKKAGAIKEIGSPEEALNFLFTCLEGIDIQKIDKIMNCQSKSRLGTDLKLDFELKPCLQSSHDGLTSQQRREALMHLLQTAMSLHSVCRNAGILRNAEGPAPSGTKICIAKNDKAAVSVDEILLWPVETLCLNESLVKNKLQSNINFVSSNAQTEAMDLREHVDLEIKPQLRLCNVSGAGHDFACSCGS